MVTETGNFLLQSSDDFFQTGDFLECFLVRFFGFGFGGGRFLLLPICRRLTTFILRLLILVSEQVRKGNYLKAVLAFVTPFSLFRSYGANPLTVQWMLTCNCFLSLRFSFSAFSLLTRNSFIFSSTSGSRMGLVEHNNTSLPRPDSTND